MAFTRKSVWSAGIAICFIAAVAVMFFIFKKSDSVPSAALEDVHISQLVFKNIEGQDVSVASLTGRPIIYHMWTSWCLRCTQEIDDLSALQKEYSSAFLVVAVNRGEAAEVVKRYADQLDSQHQLLFVADSADTLYKETGGFVMPETLFVDRSGIIRDHVRGPMDAIELKRRVQDAFGF